ncbi:MAG: hypothetical protein ACKV0T_06010 [Planctomycetales bacterium]
MLDFHTAVLVASLVASIPILAAWHWGLALLQAGETVVFRPRSHAMSPKIESGQRAQAHHAIPTRACIVRDSGTTITVRLWRYPSAKQPAKTARPAVLITRNEFLKRPLGRTSSFVNDTVSPADEALALIRAWRNVNSF